ncbi:MAG TPA: hypothetical protein VMX18_02820 [Candidatus Bipolaricaulota bacterium]|nr:hypothetical protein [Candidatus Bipolaricaulota bacterium]
MQLNYKELARKSWYSAWHNKLLWLFGLFLVIGVEGGNYQGFNFDFSEKFAEMTKSGYLISVFLGFAVLIAIFLVGVVCQAALIKGVQNLSLGIKNNFKQLWAFGKTKFKKILMADLILGLLFLIAIAPIFLSRLESFLVMALLSLWFLALIVGFVFFGNYFYYFFAYLVLEDKNLKTAALLAWRLFRDNAKISIFTSFIRIGFAIAVGIGIFIISYLLAVIFSAFGYLLFVALGSSGVIIAAFLGALVVWVASLAVYSFINTFYYIFSLYVYFQLTGRNVAPVVPGSPKKVE